MKKLKDLQNTFEGDDVKSLVDFVEEIPLELQEDQRYHLAKNGRTVRIYGQQRGITSYNLLTGRHSVKITSEGVIICGSFKGIEKIVLCSDTYAPTGRSRTLGSESSSGESKRGNGSEGSYSSESNGSNGRESR